MKILITGGCGFIGSHTADILIKRGYEVVIVDNILRKESLNTKARYIKLDIASKKFREILERESPEIVFHLAATINVRKSFEKPIEYLKNNIMGTVNVLDSCILCKVRKIIFSSSVAVYGEPYYLPVDEKHPTINPNPTENINESRSRSINPYAISKLTSELYIQMFNNKYGIDYTILRYSNVYGPGQNIDSGAVIPSFINSIIKNKQPVIYGDGKQTRDFVYVEDVARANLLSIEWKNGIYNIGTGKEVSIIDIFQKISSVLGKKLNPIFEEQKNEIRRIFVSIERARKLGWEPKVDIDEGIKRTVEYYRTIKFNKNINRIIKH